MQHSVVRDCTAQPCPIGEHELDASTRDLLKELRCDARVVSIALFRRDLSHAQTFVRAVATLRDGTRCETNMFSANDALWALALDHRLQVPGKRRSPRRRTG